MNATDLSNENPFTSPVLCGVCYRNMRLDDKTIAAGIVLHFDLSDPKYKNFNLVYPELKEIKFPVVICPVCTLTQLGFFDIKVHTEVGGKWV